MNEREELTVCRSEDCGVTLLPGMNVAILLATNPAGGDKFTASGSRIQAVSCMNRKQRIIVNPRSPTVHQNSNVQEPCEEIKAERVGPATLPKFKHQWNTVKARPLWWRKNRSFRIRGPRTPVTPPNNPEKNRETMKESNSFLWIMRAPHTCVSKHAINVQKMTELRPSLNDTGAKKKPPVASPAEAAEFYQLISHCDRLRA